MPESKGVISTVVFPSESEENLLPADKSANLDKEKIAVDWVGSAHENVA